MKSFKEYLIETELMEDVPHTGDIFEIEIAREEIVLESVVVDFADDGIIIEADETMLNILKHVGYIIEDSNMPVANDSTSPIHGNNNDEDYPGSRGVWMHGGYKISYNPETFTLTVQGKNQERGHRWKGRPTPQAYRIAVQQLIDKLEDETEMYEAAEPVDYPHSGTGTSPSMQMAVDMARMQAKTNLLRSIHGNEFQDKQMPDYDEDKVQLVPGQKSGTYQATIRMRQRPPQPATPTNEAKYRGREVPLGKKMAGDVKKSKVYVRKPNGNIVKVEFGDPNMRIKKSNPKRRKSFRARHNCANPGPRWKARYWSCRAW
jgi:hypothetical protein